MVDPDQSQNLIGSKLYKDISSHFFHFFIICVILLTNRQTNGHDFNTSFADVIKVVLMITKFYIYSFHARDSLSF